MDRQNTSGYMIGMCQERFAGCECESREKRYDRFFIIAVPRQGEFAVLVECQSLGLCSYDVIRIVFNYLCLKMGFPYSDRDPGLLLEIELYG